VHGAIIFSIHFQSAKTLEATEASKHIKKYMDNSVVEVRVKGVMPTSNGCAVFLGSDDKTYVIYMDRAIGDAIQRAISGEQAERPMTHELMLTLIDGLGAEVERVIINDVESGTFFARLIVSMENELGHKIVEIDARPSDSIVLALSTQKPIYTARKVLDAVDDMTEILAKILKKDI
jgi:bifunctional DNase/RNase